MKHEKQPGICSECFTDLQAALAAGPVKSGLFTWYCRHKATSAVLSVEDACIVRWKLHSPMDESEAQKRFANLAGVIERAQRLRATKH